MESLLKPINIPKIRIQASDPNVENIKKYFNNEIISSLEKACLLSHLRTIKTFYESELDICLILEDDVSLQYLKHWNKDINTIILEAPNDWNVISLSQTLNVILDNQYTPYWNKFYSAVAYIVNKKGAEQIMKLYDTHNNIWNISDNNCTAELVIFGNSKTYIYKLPYFTFILNTKSTIHTHHYDLHKSTKNISNNIWKHQ
jgi:GR25 family glycosyltransferase involved in LPS biosynthesis